MADRLGVGEFFPCPVLEGFDAVVFDTLAFGKPFHGDGAVEGDRFLKVQLEGGVDDDGAFITVAFTLPAGSFATVLMRELMKSPAPHGAATEPVAESGSAVSDEGFEAPGE